jgi:hypothetical protein
MIENSVNGGEQKRNAKSNCYRAPLRWRRVSRRQYAGPYRKEYILCVTNEACGYCCNNAPLGAS